MHVRGILCDSAKAVYGGNYEISLANLHCCGTEGVSEK
jgi:hypothetical protein